MFLIFAFVAAQAIDDRLGLRGLVERAEELGGKLSLQSGPDQGTCIRLEVPK